MVALHRSSVQRRLDDRLAVRCIARASAASDLGASDRATPHGWTGVDVGAHGSVDVDEDTLVAVSSCYMTESASVVRVIYVPGRWPCTHRGS